MNENREDGGGGDGYDDVEDQSATIVHMTWVCTCSSLFDFEQHEIIIFSC